jgi:ABC-type transporter Mla maintaining outer membrane lipid asymmetry ATPase subunit MlaF
MHDILIKARNIYPQYDPSWSTIPFNIDIQAGIIYGFIGPNSILTSAWLQTLAAIKPPASGQLWFIGQETTNLDRIRWQKLRINIAYINHKSALLSVLSTQENILLPALYHQLASRETLMTQMNDMLEQIGFSDKYNLSLLPAYIDELSYTQALLVRIVLTRPKVIVIDNALRHFDERTSRKMLLFIKHYVNTTGASLLLHDDDAGFVLNNSNKIFFADTDGILPFNDRKELHNSDNKQVLNYLSELVIH